MSTQSISAQDVSPGRAHADRKPSSLDFEVLDREPGPLGRRLAALPGDGHPVWTYAFGIVFAFLAIASFSIVAGLVLTHVVLHVPGVSGADESLVRFLVRHRSSGLTDASRVGSTAAGGVVLPAIAGIALLVAAAARHWRVAGFLLFALAVESASYRTTTLVVHRDRPDVPRMENLPVDASYPSGHTAASIAVYWGIALLLTSRLESRAARVAIWTVAVLVPVYVACSRMYRGMHHPLDVAGGMIIGIAALCALVVVTRATGSAAR